MHGGRAALAAGPGAAGCAPGADEGTVADRLHPPARGTRSTGRAPSATIADAVACAERRIAAHDDERAVLVHGDVHQWNVLQAGDGFKLVDPDGLLAEPEYDLGIIMREDPLELLVGDPRDRSRWLAARCGLDEVAIWEWGVVERVSTGLLCVQDEMPTGLEMLAAADHVAP